MIQVGDVVLTSYGTGPYVVVEIHEDCRCPDYHTWVDCDGAPCHGHRECEIDCPLTAQTPPHLHLVCVEERTWRKGRWRKSDLRYLNGYVEESAKCLRCLWRDGTDTIEIVGRMSGGQHALALRRAAP